MISSYHRKLFFVFVQFSFHPSLFLSKPVTLAWWQRLVFERRDPSLSLAVWITASCSHVARHSASDPKTCRLWERTSSEGLLCHTVSSKCRKSYPLCSGFDELIICVCLCVWTRMCVCLEVYCKNIRLWDEFLKMMTSRTAVCRWLFSPSVFLVPTLPAGTWYVWVGKPKIICLLS